MEAVIVTVTLLGAVALLLYGLEQVKSGVNRAFGGRLRARLSTGTKTALHSFVSGFVATLALQSSTATALMISSFVERSLVSARMAQIVLLGANVGTAVTAVVVSTGIEWTSPLLILVGLVLHRSRHLSRGGGGTALIGIGLMLLSLHLLSASSEPLRASPALSVFIGLLDNAWPVALAFSALVAFLSSSSLAAIILITSIAQANVLSGGLITVLVLGANLGGAISPVVATLGEGVAARRVALANLVVRAAGCILVMPIAEYSGAALATLNIPAGRVVVSTHLAFNIALALVSWPFTSLLARQLRNLVPDPANGNEGPFYLCNGELSQPVMALASATREVLGVGDLVQRMLLCAKDAFAKGDLSALHDVPLIESRVDHLQHEVKLYLSRLAREELSDGESRRLVQIIEYAINLEHMGDIIEKGLGAEVAKKITQGLSFSREGHEEIEQLFKMTIDNLAIAQTIMTTGDFDLSKQMMELKVGVRRMERDSAQRHLKRLRDGRSESLQTSSLHLDLLRDLKRINAHIVAVAHPILHENDLLIESRLLT